MKKLMLILMFGTFVNAFALFGAGDVGAFDYQNYIQNMMSKIELIKQTKNQLQQLRNEMQNLQNQADNLKNLDFSLSNQNLNLLRNSLNKVLDFHKKSKSIISQNARGIEELKKIYIEDPAEFERSGYSAQDLNRLEQMSKNAERETSHAIYDAMASAKMTATMDNDRINAERLLEASRDSEGALQAIQATNNLLGLTNKSLSDIKLLLQASVNVAASTAGQEQVDNKKKKKDYDETMTKWKDDAEKFQKEMMRVNGKKIRIGY